MKQTFSMLIALLTTTGAFAQNSVVISQSGSGNQASITQSAGNNSATISQSGSVTSDSGAAEDQPGNHVNLQVSKGTQTTIRQQSAGPNSVALSQAGQATAVISQESSTGENRITTLPDDVKTAPRKRTSKRAKRP